MKSKSFAPSLNKTDLCAVSGRRFVPGSSRLRQSSAALPLDSSPLPKLSGSYPGNEIMSRTTAMLERLMWLWMVIILVSIGQVVIWSVDRSPPFRVLSYQVGPVHQGGVISIKADVWRDTKRDCSVVLSNNLYDSAGTRYVIEPPVSFPAGAIAEIEKKTPGRMIRKIQLPEGVAIGPASIVSTMSYACNSLQEIINPILVKEEFVFDVIDG